MLKKVENLNPKALINSEKYRQYVEIFESEILRGISKLITLHVVKQKGEEGIYGYKLARDLKAETKDSVIIEEGTLYPILRKLKSDNLLHTEKKEYNGRLRSYYKITSEGNYIYNHLMGFLTNLIDNLSHILDIKVELNDDLYLICPNCSNKIEFDNNNTVNCIACGMKLDNTKNK